MKQPKFYRPFGPAIYSNYIDNDVFSMLLDAKAESEKICQRVGDKLAGFIDQQLRFQLTDDQHALFSAHILEHVEICLGSSYIDFIIPKDSIWMNIQKANEFNPTHIHEGELSGVIYLEIPDSILLEKQTAKSNTTFNNFGDIAFYYGNLGNRYFYVTPEEQQLLLFPATLDHGVFPFYSDATRVSLAFNIFKK